MGPGSEHPEAERTRAAELIKAGRLDEANELLVALTRARPDDADAWQLLGSARYRQGAVDDAADAFRACLELRPHDAIAHYSLAVALRDLGECDLFRTHLERALELKPDFSAARERLQELPPHPGAAGAIVGRARTVQQRSEADPLIGRATRQRWTFRVERKDECGLALEPPVPVELRGARIDGAIGEGDWVEVPGEWRPGRSLRVKQLRNLTTTETVRVRNGRRRVMLALIALFVAAFAAFAVWVIQNMGEDDSGGGSGSAGQGSAERPSGGGDRTRTDDPAPAPTPNPAPQPTPSPPVRLGCSPSGGSGVDTSLPAGTPVQWVNEGPDGMKVYLEGASVAGSPGEVAPGASFEHTFAEAGTHAYRCTFNSGDEQAGSVNVQGE